jgi:hypothetical protein
VLPAVGLAQFEAGNLGDRIPLVGRLERAGQQAVFRHRLRREAGIDAGRAEEQQLRDASAPRRLDHIARDRQIIVQEISGTRVVGVDPARPRGSEQHGLRPMLIEPAIDCRLVAQIDRIAAHRQNPAFLLGQPADKRRTDHAAMASDQYAQSAQRKECRWGHTVSRFPPWRRPGPGRQTRPGSRSARAAQGRCRARPSSRPAVQR